MRLIDRRTYANLAAAIVASGKGIYRGWIATSSRAERVFDERALETWLDEGGHPPPDPSLAPSRDVHH